MSNTDGAPVRRRPIRCSGKGCGSLAFEQVDRPTVRTEVTLQRSGDRIAIVAHGTSYLKVDVAETTVRCKQCGRKADVGPLIALLPTHFNLSEGRCS